MSGWSTPDTGQLEPGHGLKIGYYAQEHENLDVDRSVLENMMSAAPDINETEARKVLGSFLFTGDDADKPARVLSGGEKTRLSLAMLVVSSANLLLLDEPTNNLDPPSRRAVADALKGWPGSIIFVSHDTEFVTELDPTKVLLMPDGAVDYFSDDWLELVSLS